jgi:hypothetical protein
MSNQHLTIKTKRGSQFVSCGDVTKKQNLFEVADGADLGDALIMASNFLDMVRDPVFNGAMGIEPLRDNPAFLVLHAIESAKAIIDSLVSAVEDLEAATSGE